MFRPEKRSLTTMWSERGEVSWSVAPEATDQDGEELWDIADDPRIFFQARRGTRNRMARPIQLDDETIQARQAIVRTRALEYCRAEV